MYKITAFANSILCVENLGTGTDVTRDLSHPQLMACLAHIQALLEWRQRAQSGPQFGLTAWLRVLPRPDDWAVWDPRWLGSQDGDAGIYESGFPTLEAAQAACRHICDEMNEKEDYDLGLEHFVAAPTPADYTPA